MCSTCDGKGSIQTSCVSCKGTGSQVTEVKENITIPRGIDSGVSLRLAKKGNFTAQGESGDLLIKVNVAEHPVFKREGFDIHTEHNITVTQAILGGTTKIDTINGKADMKIKPGTNPGDEVTL